MKRTKQWGCLIMAAALGGLLSFGCSSNIGDRSEFDLPEPAIAENCGVCHASHGLADVDRHLQLGQLSTYDAEIAEVNVTNGAETVTIEVSFSVIDPVTGQGVPGLTDDFEYTIAKWIPGDGRNAGYWQSYINRSRLQPDGVNVLRAAGERRPATDLGGGNYSYTFATNFGSAGVGTFRYYGNAGAPENPGTGQSGVITSPAGLAVLETLNLAWEPEAVHRIGIVSRAPATNYRFNAVADVVPATAEIRDDFFNWAATTESCSVCHADSQPGSTMRLPNVHSDLRFEVPLCVTCHNRNTFDSRSSTDDAWTTIEFRTMIHKIHRGEEGYAVDGRDYGGLTYPQALTGVGGVMNCRGCHDNQHPLAERPENRAASDAELWKSAPSVPGCGSCHVNVDFATHFPGLPCLTCHSATSPLGAELAHRSNFATPNNPLIPEGARVLEYEIAEVTVNEANQPTVRFRVLADGVPLNLKDLPAGITMSGANPNFKLTWSNPVGDIANPDDWTNTGGATRPYWEGNVNLEQAVADQPVTAGIPAIVASLTGPDGNGYFTTAPGIIQAEPLAFPADAVLRAVFMEGNFTFGDLGNISGESVIAGVGAADTPRRQVVDITRCNKCHERIRFHGGGGRDNNPNHCVTCHNPSMTSSNIQTETSNNFKDMIHAIHAGAPVGGDGMRENPYIFIRGNVDATTGGQGVHDFSHVGYPSLLSDCLTCHLPGTYRIPVPENALHSTYLHDLADPANSLKITRNSAACFPCHDSASAQSHMQRAGGGFFRTQEEIDAAGRP
jgi:OmcA/MtrC family decaheme c-type cytochrome